MKKIRRGDSLENRVRDVSSTHLPSATMAARTSTLAAFKPRIPNGTIADTKQVYFGGELFAHRTRNLGLVNELLEDHQQGGGCNISVVDQQQKVEDLQKAIIEEAAFLERMKDFQVRQKNVCPQLCGKKACGGMSPFFFCEAHQCCKCDCDEAGCVCCGVYKGCDDCLQCSQVSWSLAGVKTVPPRMY